MNPEEAILKVLEIVPESRWEEGLKEVQEIHRRDFYYTMGILFEGLKEYNIAICFYQLSLHAPSVENEILDIERRMILYRIVECEKTQMKILRVGRSSLSVFDSAV